MAEYLTHSTAFIPIWFANLHQKDKDNLAALLTNLVDQDGKFTEEAQNELIEKFKIDDYQAEELYNFFYHSQAGKKLQKEFRADKTINKTIEEFAKQVNDASNANDLPIRLRNAVAIIDKYA